MTITLFNHSLAIEESSVQIKDIDEQIFGFPASIPELNKALSILMQVKIASGSGLYISTKNWDDYSVIKVSKEIDNLGNEINWKREELNHISVIFSDANLISEKILNAFAHLIDIAAKNSDYNTTKIVEDKDPFSNSIIKDTVIANSISTANTNSIPMTKKGGVYEIPVIINSVLKLNFIFDAGASDVSISPDVTLTLIRTGTVSDEDFLGTETYKFADGSTAKSKVFIIKEIQLGNKTVNNIKASISNSINAPLLLGQSVLSKFGKVIIDYNKGVIIFQN